jgi:hypothetical protein
MIEENNFDDNNLIFHYNVFDNNNIFNNIENTYNPFFGLGSYNPPKPPNPPNPPNPTPIPCFLKGTKILTINGEKNIEYLKKDDILISYNGKKIKLKNIYTFICKDKNKFTLPYKIPKNTLINDNLCNKDLYLSPLHAILFEKNNFTAVENLSFKQIHSSNIDSLIYYHLVLPNYYTDTIFANGIICEGYGENLKNNKMHKILFKNIYKNKCRKLLSSNEFNKLIEDICLLRKKNKKIHMNFT